ncbi:hypothetical protein PM082_024775 [Marasmius tenuissimus]|nr:hypothetical protein PM082_024775 [Marasmius tenuissimus]
MRGIEPRAAVRNITTFRMKDSNVSHYTTSEILREQVDGSTSQRFIRIVPHPVLWGIAGGRTKRVLPE